MSSEVKIYGGSDDIIVCEGKVKGCDEFYGTNNLVVLLPSEDTFRVTYGNDGLWSVVHEKNSGKLEVTIVPAPPDDDDVYTAFGTVKGEIENVQFWEAWPPSACELENRAKDAIEDGKVTTKQWQSIGKILFNV